SRSPAGAPTRSARFRFDQAPVRPGVAPRGNIAGALERSELRVRGGSSSRLDPWGMVAMRITPFLAFIAVLSPQISDAREIRRDAIPDCCWGTWAPGTSACNDADKPPVVLSAKSYAGPAGTCDILYVTEVPGRDGAIYSARMSCSSSQPQAKTTANLIIRP